MRVAGIVVGLALFGASGAGAIEPGDIQIRNWEAPRFYQPSNGGARVRGGGEVDSASRRSGVPLAESAAVVPALGSPSPTRLSLVSVPPCRLLDTRGQNPPSPAYGPPALANNAIRNFDLEGRCGIPPFGALSAQAISANVTVTNTNGWGFLTLWEGYGAQNPGTSTVNWTASGQTVGNGAIIPLDLNENMSAQQLTIGGGTVDFILDVNGYYTVDQITGPYVKYTVSETQSIPSGVYTPLNFGTEVDATLDSVGIVTATAPFTFFIPVTGVYEVAARTLLGGTALTDGIVEFFPVLNRLNTPNVLEYRSNFGSRNIKAGTKSGILVDGSALFVATRGYIMKLNILQTTGTALTVMTGQTDTWVTVRFVRAYP